MHQETCLHMDKVSGLCLSGTLCMHFRHTSSLRFQKVTFPARQLWGTQLTI